MILRFSAWFLTTVSSYARTTTQRMELSIISDVRYSVVPSSKPIQFTYGSTTEDMVHIIAYLNAVGPIWRYTETRRWTLRC